MRRLYNGYTVVMQWLYSGYAMRGIVRAQCNVAWNLEILKF